MSVISISNITKCFGEKTLFQDFSLEIQNGTFYAITGRSGCGKSTLLNIIGGIESVSSGDITILGHKNIKQHGTKLRKLLRNHISFLFQNYALSDADSVEANLMMALQYSKVKDKKLAIKEALKTVQLEGLEKQKIYTLSGGEQQRVAIARMLLKPTSIVLADEPTGNLDAVNRDIVFNLLKDMKTHGVSIVMVTHDLELAKQCDVHIQL